ncbi:non-hydrolyzing UDP-N-acetylglucosamine 2-epimerase [Halovivax sp.]|uniref:non-hydrolyzing UDP-N-acetylglucosamine 2-epimerase n=1 Tax=Halovivax sp. TaxID=1935978 RepID=UPI0025B9DC91|nr:UDP-N-acetylglucosamine 2-epimerase (non-hydrolyzing) [Halovivax sp.]
MSVLTVVGARPQFVKAAAVSRQLRGRLEETVVHTGQHYDRELSAVFFEELDLEEPDHHLGVGSASHAVQTAEVMVGLERIIEEERPEVVLVYGDTNSTLAGAMAAAKREPAIAHVEAGLRSGDTSMPEEVNRICTDHCADRLYAPSRDAVANLEREGIGAGVVESGDVMYDTLLSVRDGLADVSIDGIDVPEEFVLATVHRAGNTDDPERLVGIVDGLSRLPKPVILPAHPRTVEALEREGLRERANEGIDLVEPQGYLPFLRLVAEADCVATDSGGVQKEAFYLETPCVTLRDTTEWVETIEAGWNVLVGADADRIVDAVGAAGDPPAKPDLYGGGTAAARIVDDLERLVA